MGKQICKECHLIVFHSLFSNSDKIYYKCKSCGKMFVEVD